MGLLLKRIVLTLKLWFELRKYDYDLDDCWVEAGDILDRTESYKGWKHWRDKYDQ